MKRIKIEVAYDGTNYHGWQVQPNAITVEEVINRELSELLKEEIKVIGASRTDAGVHALGNVAVFDTNTIIPPEKICYALNQKLPEDIRVQNSCQVADRFHPRHCDSRKIYEYYVSNREIELPTDKRYVYHYRRKLSLKKMREAAEYIIGTHNFKSFCSAKTQVEDTTRTIYNLEVEPKDYMVVFRVEGNGFLYNMVRIIVGTLLQVGVGALPVEQMESILEGQDRTKAGPSAPAHGLRLVKIKYE